MAFVGIYILVGLVVSVSIALKIGMLTALCAAGASIISPIGAGGAVRGVTEGKGSRGVATLILGVLIVSLAFWLGRFFSLRMFGYSISGEEWVIAGAVLGFFFAR